MIAIEARWLWLLAGTVLAAFICICVGCGAWTSPGEAKEVYTGTSDSVDEVYTDSGIDETDGVQDKSSCLISPNSFGIKPSDKGVAGGCLSVTNIGVGDLELLKAAIEPKNAQFSVVSSPPVGTQLTPAPACSGTEVCALEICIRYAPDTLPDNNHGGLSVVFMNKTGNIVRCDAVLIGQ